MLDDKVGEWHYWLLIGNVTSWFSGTILTGKRCMLGVATRDIHFICFLCRLFSPTYHSEGDRWTHKFRDGNSRLQGCIQSFMCWATLLVIKWIIGKTPFSVWAVVSSGFFCLVSVSFIWLWCISFYFGHLRWFFSSQLPLTAVRCFASAQLSSCGIDMISFY